MKLTKIISQLEKYIRPTIKRRNLLYVSLLVSAIFNVHRLFVWLDIMPEESGEFFPVNPADMLFRFLVLFLYIFIVLDINLIWFKKTFPKISHKKFRLIIVSGNVFVFGTSFILYVFGLEFVHGVAIHGTETATTLFGWVIIMLSSLLIGKVVEQQRKSKADDIDKEILKREKVQSELNEIKNQLNPHFLFNSLNSLHSLIRKKPDEASDFVTNLSKLYRYVLQSSEKDLVSIKEELSFLKSYTDLLHIRYKNKFDIDIKIDESDLLKKIPVLSIQLLVENAVKHNEISEEFPLRVLLYVKDNCVYVSNKLRPRKSLTQGTGNGILNLSKRCEILIGGKVRIMKDDSFTVSIPVKKEIE